MLTSLHVSIVKLSLFKCFGIISQPHGSHSLKIILMTLFIVEHVCVNARARQSSKKCVLPQPP